MGAPAVLPSRDEVHAALAARSLKHFMRMAFPIVEPGVPFQDNWHLDVMCEYLEAAANREIRKLIINVPPRSMKSLLLSVMWPTWVWLQQPAVRWMYASYAEELAKDFSIGARLIIESEGGRDDGQGTLMERIGYKGLRALIGADWELAGLVTQLRFHNTKRGYRMSTSVGAKATGFGGDFIIADDPHNSIDTQSDLKREEVLTWWDQTMSTRMNNPKTGVRVVIMQRLHEKDLTGHLLERGGWTHLCLPMEYEPQHPHVTPNVVILPNGRVLRGDERTEPGELLWPGRFGKPEVEELKVNLRAYGTSGQLQQRPTPAEGGIFKRVWWRFYPPDTSLPHMLFDRLYTTWDTALKERTSSDYTVGIAWGAKGPDRYVLRVVRGQWGMTEAKAQVKAMHTWLLEEVREDAVPQHYFENAAMGPDLMAAMRRKIQGVTPLDADGDKVARAEAVTPVLEAGNVFVPGEMNADMTGYDPTLTPAMIADLIEECSAFPNGSYDDQVDAFVYGLNPRKWVGAKRKVRSGGRTVTARHRRGG